MKRRSDPINKVKVQFKAEDRAIAEQPLQAEEPQSEPEYYPLKEVYVVQLSYLLCVCVGTTILKVVSYVIPTDEKSCNGESTGNWSTLVEISRH